MIFTTLEWIIIIGLGGLFFIGCGVGAYILISRLRWNYTYSLWENVAGAGWVPIRKGKMRLVGFGDEGAEVFYLKDLKKWRVGYGKRIGKNYIAWAKGTDGYWYNVNFTNFDKELRKIGINPVDRDVRMAHTTINKQLKEEYQTKSFMDKYGMYIAYGLLLLCIVAFVVGTYMVFSQIHKNKATDIELRKVDLEVMKKMDEVVTKLDIVNSGGKGYVEVPA